jgi:2-C-methyl-D-erythritol 4-phosphate cytidylyltransferase
MHTTAIILAAGSGSRLKSKISKPLVRVNGTSLLRYSLEAFCAHPRVTDVIVTCNADNERAIRSIIAAVKPRKPVLCVRGGDRRQDSVRNALGACDECCRLVMIHDGGRPFIDSRTIARVINAALRRGAAIAAVPVKATIKRVEGRRSKDEGRGPKIVRETLDRSTLWEVQTPQAFRKELIVDAFRRFGDGNVTDDASLVEKAGVPVEVVASTYFNLKVTTPEDLVLAEAIAKYRRYHR